MEFEDLNQTNQMNKEPTEKDINPQEHIDTALVISTDTMDMGRNKRQHTSESSDSDKEIPHPVAETALALITTTEPQGVWKKVEKEKGRKV